MFNAAKTITSKGYHVVYVVNSLGNVTKSPRPYVCPECLKAAVKHTSNEVLQRKAAKHVVIGVEGSNKIALCAKCGWMKTNATTKPSCPAEKITPKKDVKKTAKKATKKKAIKF